MSIILKKNKKFQQDGCNLDINYISKPNSTRYPGRIIVMSKYLSFTNSERKFLDIVHPGCYKVFNLSSNSDESFFETEQFLIEENNCCSLSYLHR